MAADKDVPPFGRHVVLAPEGGAAPDAAVVWLHGFGDEPEGWVSILKRARAKHPSWMWVHVRGRPLPQTCYKGEKIPGWGDYHEEGCTRVGSRDYDNQDIVLESTVSEVHRVIDDLESSHGLSPHQVVVGGFSMGATAAAECGLRYSRRLAGIVILNGWLLPGARAALNADTVKDLPILVSHGSADEMVGFDCGQEAARLLRAAGADVRFEVQRRRTHVSSGFGPGRILAVRFLKEVFMQAPQKCKRRRMLTAEERDAAGESHAELLAHDPPPLGEQPQVVSS